MQNTFDDFDTQVQPEELFFEDIQDDNPIDEDYLMNEIVDYYGNNDWGECEFDEGSDRDNWEEEQIFQDGIDW